MQLIPHFWGAFHGESGSFFALNNSALVFSLFSLQSKSPLVHLLSSSWHQYPVDGYLGHFYSCWNMKYLYICYFKRKFTGKDYYPNQWKVVHALMIFLVFSCRPWEWWLKLWENVGMPMEQLGLQLCGLRKHYHSSVSRKASKCKFCGFAWTLLFLQICSWVLIWEVSCSTSLRGNRRILLPFATM